MIQSDREYHTIKGFSYSLCDGTKPKIGELLEVRIQGSLHAGSVIVIDFDVLTIVEKVQITNLDIIVDGNKPFSLKSFEYKALFEKGFSNVKNSWILPDNIGTGKISGRFQLFDNNKLEWLCVNYKAIIEEY